MVVVAPACNTPECVGSPCIAERVRCQAARLARAGNLRCRSAMQFTLLLVPAMGWHFDTVSLSVKALQPTERVCVLSSAVLLAALLSY